jgi:hypothetical protein
MALNEVAARSAKVIFVVIGTPFALLFDLGVKGSPGQ